MSIQTSYLSPESQWLDLTNNVLILRQNSGAIAITSGTGYGWGPSADGYGLGRAQHGGAGTAYNEYILLSREDYDLIYQYIYFDAGITFFEDFLRTTEFLFSQDLNADGEVPDTTIDRAFHYAFDGSTLQKTGALNIEFSQTPSNLQLVFERLDHNGDRVGGIGPYIDSSSFVSGKVTKIDSGLLIGSYDGVNDVLKLTFGWEDFYGVDYKNVIGSGSVMISIAAGSDSLSDGAIFATSMYGTNAVDEIYGSSSNEEIFALSGDDFVESGLGNDIADGGKGNDYLDGGEGEDVLIGGAGNDTMLGSFGNDTFTVDSIGDVILENENEGNDSVNSYISYTLSEHLENINLHGSKAINANGNNSINLLIGNSAANILNGLGGQDTLQGGAGNDTYVVYGDGEMIVDTTGIDLVRSSATWILEAGLENLTLFDSAAVDGTGNEFNNTITGNSSNNILEGESGNDILIGGAGNDTLDGGIGEDRMSGGTGDDIYVVDNIKDTITEKAGEGKDTIETTLASLSIAKLSAIENLIYSGLNNATLVGNTLANTLRGATGNDTLNGGVGADTMAGASGNDIYIVDNQNDCIEESSEEGADSIQSSVSYILSSHIESLILIGKSAINGTGNNQNNSIIGNAAANILFGDQGNDTLDGGAGNDILLGEDGSDLLIGGLGNDTLSGGFAADAFRFDKALGKNNIDTINDFVSGTDKIELDDFILKKFIGDSDLSDNFSSSSQTTGPLDYLIAKAIKVGEIDSMALFYDADGSGKGAAVQFATLIGVIDLSAADFMIV